MNFAMSKAFNAPGKKVAVERVNELVSHDSRNCWTAELVRQMDRLARNL